ncbi:transcriptional regulator, CopG family [Candidatus Koribacter versatilis Ellin345]|uniref:Transcriptional regulator, CopG family n=1 Tax=Koribacter versatilis (strain Ellin345) TaxID=204669 RepID=Q1IH71_KORVE|nr:ribbon-helix-helix protein, CopG family [Candidatus Koribacter versatilis]ABF43779.1 transcriptional regulator, CopG family [Candidatus Koribacter versatilis Ellin345]
MEKQLISVRLRADKVAALDALAESLDRDRSYLLNEAVEDYLEVQKYHLDRINQAIKAADDRELVDHADVKKLVAKLKRRK